VLEAVLLDNGYLTDVRTAAAGAVAAKALSHPDSNVAAILGAGTQSRLQLEALTLVRPIQRAVIWARDASRAAATAAELSKKLNIEVTTAPDVRSAVEVADIVVTTTPATQPLIKAQWLQAGQHVTAMGSDQPNKSELEPACLERAALYVPDRRAQCALAGELRGAIEAGIVDKDASGPELGDVVAGTHPGRTGDGNITIADLTGTGLQDTAIATLARERASAAGAGTVISS